MLHNYACKVVAQLQSQNCRATFCKIIAQLVHGSFQNKKFVDIQNYLLILITKLLHNFKPNCCTTSSKIIA